MYAMGNPARRMPAPGTALSMIRDFNAVNPLVNPSIVQKPVPIESMLAYP